MTDLKDAARQALEALSLALSDVDWRANSPTQPVINKAHAALRAALEQPEATNQCGETCERAKLCAICARGLAEPEWEPEWLTGCPSCGMDGGCDCEALEQEPGGVCARCGGWVCDPVLKLEQTEQEDEMQKMLRSLGFDDQCPESIGITLRRWKDGYAAALEQPEREPVAWLPIATAPKTGRKVIVFYLNRNVKPRTVMARWLTDEQAAENDGDDVGLKGGWYECVDNWDDYTEVAIYEGEPTHWMPLPSAPGTTHPPRREWRGLTDDEIGAITTPLWDCFRNGRAIEAALKERNA